MFSVDNFYIFFKSHYGWDKTGVMPWIFTPHGSKNFLDCHPYEDKPTYLELKKQQVVDASGIIILHDQEPLIREYALDIYRNRLYQKKKHNMWLQLTDEELWMYHWNTCTWPIICHSEKNSADIEWVQNLGVIDCHYFYHGLIARDWYRHWKHHSDLFNKHTLSHRFLLYVRDCTGTREYRKEVLEKLTPIKDQIKSNWGVSPGIGSDFSAKIVVEDSLDTGIQLILETLFVENKVHVTEKVFKPMVMMQPFIVFSGPGTLAYLKSYGFRTFDEIWDESYDKEIDPDKRMEKILNLIRQLYSMSDSEFHDTITKSQEIVRHNQRHFFSEEFEKIMLDELHQNVRHALELQRQKTLSDPGGSWFWMYDRLYQRNVDIDDEAKLKMTRLIDQLKLLDPKRYSAIKRQYSWVW